MADSTLDRVTWWEIPVADLEKGKAFYGAVFGWTFQPFGEGFAGVFTSDGDMVGGLDGTRGEKAGHGIAVYVNVADLEGVLARVGGAGGTVLHDRTEVGGDMGWWADFTDPDGVRVGLCTASPAWEAAG